MKVILTQQVPHVGEAFEIKDVADGFGRNFLLARGVAVLATPEELTKLEARKAQLAAKSELDKQTAQELKTKFAGFKLAMQADANDKGTLFAALTTKDIVKALTAEHGIKIKASSLTIKKPIKEVGPHEIAYDLGFGITGTFQLDITSRAS
ncbi:MAG: 50S ribosomal protein L9 [Parcubacteria group bacterium GW2011_GWA2_47_8]|nr:MAG: 50S ribosomal protein L9 [Parcubacteria group bacterium GW2011_GWA2_47_8]OHB19573.1 MAG: 50S ribosomal protein L9 [Parcubacteria group bacterium RIFCSPHIGHO2_01_FULL_47_10b]